ncbi:hypothetical protein [Glutamicibacter arilaitensis]|uniref:Uncharacterized protein n=1 Tax=Glutamicibacter arilaitensis TaxID=256701 RepID=A0A4Y8U0D9_9MICC|nr:hypothetical protein [Glutamicibacter arilaitensis]TFH57291.1 hypothetical protein EXY26_09935 [Glutamicibacter arilaitensis]
MKLNGTARGRNMEELMIDAHRQTKLFYGNDNYDMQTGTPHAYTDYEYFTDGSVAPTRTTFDMDFTAESPAIIKDERTTL